VLLINNCRINNDGCVDHRALSSCWPTPDRAQQCFVGIFPTDRTSIVCTCGQRRLVVRLIALLAQSSHHMQSPSHRMHECCTDTELHHARCCTRCQEAPVTAAERAFRGHTVVGFTAAVRCVACTAFHAHASLLPTRWPLRYTAAVGLALAYGQLSRSLQTSMLQHEKPSDHE